MPPPSTMACTASSSSFGSLACRGLDRWPRAELPACMGCSFSRSRAVGVAVAPARGRANGHERLRLRTAQVWLGLLSLASFRSPFVPDAYALIGTLWLLTLMAAEGHWQAPGASPSSSAARSPCWCSTEVLFPFPSGVDHGGDPCAAGRGVRAQPGGCAPLTSAHLQPGPTPSCPLYPGWLKAQGSGTQGSSKSFESILDELA